MNRNYFLIGTLIGLVFSYLIGLFLMGGQWQNLLGESSKYSGAVPVIGGVLPAIIAGIYFDRKNQKFSFLKAGLLLPAIIFLLGSVVGCLANFIVNGNFQHFDSWFVKPLYWLVVIGLPLSLVIGSLYYLLVQRFTQLQKMSSPF